MASIPPRNSRPRGFTLVEVLVVLFIFAIVIAMAAVITRSITLSQKRALTASRMANVDAALIQFVAVQRRLPCPADGRLASTNANAGLEIAPDGTGCVAANQRHGVVPWRALGLTEQEMTDGWERRLTYRVTPRLGVIGPPGGLDMSQCDPAGTEAPPLPAVPRTCTLNCVSTNLLACTPPSAFLNNNGLQVQNLAGTVLMDPAAAPPTGAAYVLISHGESGGGAYLYSGVLSTSTTTDGDQEKANNYADIAIPGALPGPFIDDDIVAAAGAGHFDDILSRPSVLAVATKAGLGPRSH